MWHRWVIVSSTHPVSYEWFIGALEDIADKVAAPPFNCLPANEAKVIHMTNTLERKDVLVFGTPDVQMLHKNLNREV